jgi:hypothetical protein
MVQCENCLRSCKYTSCLCNIIDCHLIRWNIFYRSFRAWIYTLPLALYVHRQSPSSFATIGLRLRRTAVLDNFNNNALDVFPCSQRLAQHSQLAVVQHSLRSEIRNTMPCRLVRPIHLLRYRYRQDYTPEADINNITMELAKDISNGTAPRRVRDGWRVYGCDTDITSEVAASGRMSNVFAFRGRGANTVHMKRV